MEFTDFELEVIRIAIRNRAEKEWRAYEYAELTRIPELQDTDRIHRITTYETILRKLDNR